MICIIYNILLEHNTTVPTIDSEHNTTVSTIDSEHGPTDKVKLVNTCVLGVWSCGYVIEGTGGRSSMY